MVSPKQNLPGDLQISPLRWTSEFFETEQATLLPLEEHSAQAETPNSVQPLALAANSVVHICVLRPLFLIEGVMFLHDKLTNP